MEQRRALLDAPQVLRQPAFIESTRTYKPGPPFLSLLSGEDPRLLTFAEQLANERLLFNPPYLHQGQSLSALIGAEQRHVVVFTGTGSGKTECFTIPTLLRLYREAVTKPSSFKTRAVRALVLYPMNALVNDQLSRVRRLYGSDAVARLFKEAAGRPLTFGQYTGRTPFPGLRRFDADTDGRKMKSFEDFYMKTVEWPANDPNNKSYQSAVRLRQALTARGRWPAKPDLVKWYGKDRWDQRLHPHDDDREMLARHEFYGYRTPKGGRYGAPPDVLITNYSMLEYMLMRRVERPIFDRTREWLEANPDETFFLILDEAHLYRGAQGTEVALLIRRLLERLELTMPARRGQLRIAITSASFSGPDRAREFAAGLVGRDASEFIAIGGELANTAPGAPGDGSLADALASVDLQAFYSATSAIEKFNAVRPALAALQPKSDLALTPTSADDIARVAHEALQSSPLRQRLVSLTQASAMPIPELAEELFGTTDVRVAARATEVLAALCAFARPAPSEANLLPSRIHTFHRGLPGLWACVNPSCPCARGNKVIGALYAQPRDRCEHCSARVFQLFTCRSCGAAYFRAGVATAEVSSPKFLWSSGNAEASGATEVLAVDVLLEPERGRNDLTEAIDLDPVTGAARSSARSRRVGLYRVAPERAEPVLKKGRLFYRCGVCGDDNDRGKKPNIDRRSTVEDHVTKGEEPFFSLVSEQLSSQPPRLTKPSFLAEETPLRGRKVLIFSDGRQRAARLAAELGRAALRDSVRALLLRGYQRHPSFNLREAYAALLVGASVSGVALRATDERIDADLANHLRSAAEAIEEEFDAEALREVCSKQAPKPVATILLQVIRNKHTGLTALGLAQFSPTKRVAKKLSEQLSADSIPENARVSVVSLWLEEFVEKAGASIVDASSLEGASTWLAGTGSRGKFRGLLAAITAAWGSSAQDEFATRWLPTLRQTFASDASVQADEIILDAGKVTVSPVTEEQLASWARCGRCSRVQCAMLPGASCVHCETSGEMERLEAGSVARRRFDARKGYYRTAALRTDEPPRPLVAREHSAALTGVAGEVQTRAERHELAFQDITAKDVDGMRSAIDVLSCTTTMEVGIDIGDLSAVALRNMPPGRANYQQRAGRAGRRGNAIATVLAFADQDGHNQHSFDNPRRLIKDPVPDPMLNLSNARLARRHVNAFVLQRFAAFAMPGEASSADSDPAAASLMASLGPTLAFIRPDSPSNPMTLDNFRAWLDREDVRTELRAALDRWLPPNVAGRAQILSDFATSTLRDVEAALRTVVAEEREAGVAELEDLDESEQSSPASLLELLLYRGVLPKYAFPTDLVALHVFEATNGLGASPRDARNKVRYAPQRALSLALSEYAPGRTVFIDGRSWTSTALHAPIESDIAAAIKQQESFYYCERCEFGRLSPTPFESCPACGDSDIASRPASKWIRPPGFAHAVTLPADTDPNPDLNSRPGRAILVAESPSPSEWSSVEGFANVRAYLNETVADGWAVLVTNRGPSDEGFRLCTSCFAIEPQRGSIRLLSSHSAPRPQPTGYSRKCDSPNLLENVFLGTSFLTDVLLLRFTIPAPQQLRPGVRVPVFDIAMRSLSTALSLAASMVLEIEGGEVIAGYRPAFNAEGPDTSAVEVYLYDQLAGGAGYVVELARRLPQLFDAARALLTHAPWESRAPQPPCDRACYSCLLSFKNSFEHGSMDRLLALDLLECARSGSPARIDEERSRRAYDAMASWVELFEWGQVLRDHEVETALGPRRAPLAIRRPDGQLVVPAIHHPFSQGVPDDEALAIEAGAVCPITTVASVSYLDVSRALPAAMEQVRRLL
ncbi:MAG: DEAD/DEAH box helicase [Myxococcales bacterium]|nr:DEAD/DEAH box helicase [Myxococcales bacterium]